MSSTAEFVESIETGRLPERDYWTGYLGACLEEMESAAEPPEHSRLELLAQIFGLDEFEKLLLAALWVCALFPEMRHRLLTLDPAFDCISPLLLSRVFDKDPVFHLGSESPLNVWELVIARETVNGSPALSIDPHIVEWLEGNHELDKCLLSRARLLSAGFELASWNLGLHAAEIADCLKSDTHCRVFLGTDDEVLAETFAAALAKSVGLPVSRYEVSDLPADLAYRYAIRIQRQSFLDRCAPFFDESSQSLTRPANVSGFPLQFVHGAPATCISSFTVKDVLIELPSLTHDDRKSIWLSSLPEIGEWPSADLEDLTWRSYLSATEIKRLSAARPKNVSQVTGWIRTAGRDEINDLAQRIDSHFDWPDLVVPADVEARLREISFEARERNRLWSDERARRMFPQGRGLIALFSGPPGSGKTMAAQVIANDLGLDLLRVDLSTVVSKWVGETTQNLQKIFSARSSRQTVLFFDEADSLFARRVSEVKDANDRYVNMDSGHLMVALESFDGIILMATNLRANIDPAFIRRIRHTVEFTKPDPDARKRIWSRVICALYDDETERRLARGVERLATLEATGAQIKTTVLSSVFATRSQGAAVSARLLGELLGRELAKDGRGISGRNLEKVLEEVDV